MPPIVVSQQEQHACLQSALSNALSRVQQQQYEDPMLDQQTKINQQHILLSKRSSTPAGARLLLQNSHNHPVLTNTQKMYINTNHHHRNPSSNGNSSTGCSSPPSDSSVSTSPDLAASILVDGTVLPASVIANLHRRLDRSHSEPVWQQQQQQPSQDGRQAATSTNSSRYKTELCRPFEENGFCKYGDKCQFAHGSGELRTLTRHPKYKTDLCRTFHTIGICPYGPRCHFVHNAEESRMMLEGGSNGGPPALVPASPLTPGFDGRASSSVSSGGSSPPGFLFDEASMQSADVLSLAESVASSLRISNKMGIDSPLLQSSLQQQIIAQQLGGYNNLLNSALLAKTQQLEDLLLQGGPSFPSSSPPSTASISPPSSEGGSSPTGSGGEPHSNSNIRLPVFQNLHSL